ncbi:unnamed protein product [Spirodela intermedia]|uniref:PB1 domain-containing protein n=1 Tax=Spirodela intermedia TaxID=51605 RepID=A0A7I8L4Y6_SPIIN|nr:unnamed protein product [Spirodela intermedia]
MVAGSSSSSSSLSSLTSYGGLSEDAGGVKGGGGSSTVVKFLCSYGGKILPRYPDGKLRYVGGDTRVLAVDRALSFSELSAKMAELCGWGVPVSLRCQHPTEDLDALVSVTSDEDLDNLLEEYDVAGRDRDSQHKVRAFLTPLHPPAVAKYPATPTLSASKGKSPFVPSATARPVHIQQQLQNLSLIPPSSSPRLPFGPPAAVCYGHRLYHRQDLHHRACIIHGGSSGCPGASSYRYHHHQQHPHLIHLGKHWQ